MIKVLMVIVFLLIITSLGIITFLWAQFSSTESRLVRLIEDRIRLNNINYDLDKIEVQIIDESKQE